MINPRLRLSLIALLFAVNVTLVAQSEFLPGSITKSNGQTEEVTIKTAGWKNNPYFITYKSADSDKIITGKLEDIAAFEVYGKAKYVRADVAFDRSSDLQGQLSTVRDPLWENETLFLKVLVESETPLFLHKTNKTMRFYYQNGTNTYEPLVFKKFLSGQRVQRNRAYRKQIQDNFSCGYDLEGLRKVDYEIKDMVSLFVSLNECQNQEVKVMQSEGAKGSTVWAFQAGPNVLSGTMTKSIIAAGGTQPESYATDIDSKLALRIGIEGEYMLPQSVNKWAMFFGASYTGFQASGRWNDVLYFSNLTFQRGFQRWEATVSSINFKIGMRRYVQLNDKSRLFLSFGWQPGLNLDLNSSATISLIDDNILTTGAQLDAQEVSNFIIGLGGQFENLMLELRYNTKRQVFNESILYDLEYQGFSIILGYKFLKNLNN
ncbi:hypothetical protein [Roseivirga misakiensis]|uniref:Outer membrane protein beta-barrel domain-containing protein n=1 Tax=Roseivirga misakiensis TaxID=1563681 RepID=A0A1E5T0Q1_9BACT|nr:hypothetical protein [Roseivirga misakiensis]OEK04960.1 hypothetical protein BFP71_16145 [Roseivirga misakiensis]